MLFQGRSQFPVTCFFLSSKKTYPWYSSPPTTPSTTFALQKIILFLCQCGGRERGNEVNIFNQAGFAMKNDSMMQQKYLSSNFITIIVIFTAVDNFSLDNQSKFVCFCFLKIKSFKHRKYFKMPYLLKLLLNVY